MEKLTEAEQRYFESKGTEAPEPEPAAPEGEATQPEAASPGAAAPEAPMAKAAEPQGRAAEAARTKPDESAQREGRRVPLAELLAERERRKEAETRLAEARQRAEALSDQVQKIFGARGPEPLPDPDKDPAAYMNAVRERAAREAEEIARRRNEREAAQAKEQELRQFLSAYRAQASEFARRQPDFADAYRHLLADRDAELLGLGFADPALRARIVHEEEEAIVRRARADGANTAERIYAAAKRRGYPPRGERGGETEARRPGPGAGALAGRGVRRRGRTAFAGGPGLSRRRRLRRGDPGRDVAEVVGVTIPSEHASA